MNTDRDHRFSPNIISCTVWRSYRFNLSRRDAEDHLEFLKYTQSTNAV